MARPKNSAFNGYREPGKAKKGQPEAEPSSIEEQVIENEADISALTQRVERLERLQAGLPAEPDEAAAGDDEE